MSNNNFSRELLVSYIIFLAEKSRGDGENVDTISREDIENIEMARANDNAFDIQLKDMLHGYLAVQDELDKAEVGKIELNPMNHKETPTSFNRKRFASSKGGIITLLFCIVIMLSLKITSDLLKPSYFIFFKQNLVSEFSISRGSSVAMAGNAKASFNSGHFDDAIKMFNDELRKSESVGSKQLYNYYLGVSHLQKSQRSYLGLFPYLDISEVNKALKYFSVALAEPLQSNLLEENIRFHTGLAYGLRYAEKPNRQDLDNAINHLSKISSREHSRKATQFANILNDMTF